MAHTPENELSQSLEQAKELIPIGGVYAHYKDPDRTYTIIGHAILEADEAVGIIYKANYGAGICFVRSLMSWMEEVQAGDTQVPRFSKVR